MAAGPDVRVAPDEAGVPALPEGADGAGTRTGPPEGAGAGKGAGAGAGSALGAGAGSAVGSTTLAVAPNARFVRPASLSDPSYDV
ncbi:MAG: hypothetical protein E6044_08450, partial [Actinomyces sp.]|nr:hypothetical protein [Actinomyces sp.]